MHPDAYMEIGSTHTICEDYALGTFVTHRGKPLPTAIVSDGCSGSPHTELGSSLLSHAAVVEIKAKGAEFSAQEVLYRALSVKDALLLPASCFDATLLTLIPTPEGEIRVGVVGDGVVSGKRLDGSIETWVLSYQSPNGQGAPGYLTYLTDQGRWDTWTTQNGEGFWNTRKVTRFLDGEQVETLSEVVDTPDKIEYSFKLNPSDYEVLAVFSDGAESFMEKKAGEFEIPVPTKGPGESLPSGVQGVKALRKEDRLFLQGRHFTGLTCPVSVHEVLSQCFNIRSTSGRFVTRRCKRFLNQFCVQNGWSHYDDFSMAALYLGKGE